MIKLASTPKRPPVAGGTGTFPGPIGATTNIHDVAMTAYLALQVAAFELDDSEAVLRVADAWFSTHESTDPLYSRAVSRRRSHEATHWCQLRTAWTACCQFWQALSLMPSPTSWCALHAPEIDPASFHHVWVSVMGERPLPDGLSYPPSRNGHEYFLPFAPWQQDELEERRTKQTRKRGVRR